MIEHGHATHTGLTREHNEDSYWADAERGLWLVADGMGGPARGEVASTLALDAVVTAHDAGIGLPDAFRRAGAAVFARAGQDEPGAPMGSTLAALKLVGSDGYELAWIGDSRIYVWQNGALLRVPRPVGAEAQPGDAAPAEDAAHAGSTHPRATQTLGITPTLELDVEPVTGLCVSGMQFLLCTDGLTEELDDAHIAAILSRVDLGAQECVDHLVLAALEAGGRDNLAVVLVRIR